MEYDLVVIGGGPAGYAGAIHAGQLGKKVLCIEEERAGGTCLNWGCIPTKALLTSAELYEAMKHGGDYGLNCGEVRADFEKVMKRSRGVADTMGKGIEFLFKKNKVEYIVGRGQVMGTGVVKVASGKEGERVVKTKNILVATGCKARTIPGLVVDGKRVMTSREALGTTVQPKSIVIVGAGAIGCEFAYFLSTLGTKVTLVEMMGQILPQEDEEVAGVVARSFKGKGIDIYTNAKAEGIEVGAQGVSLDIVSGNDTKRVEAETLLLAIGLVGNLNGVFAEGVNVATERGFLVVNESYETSIKGIYGAGDIIGAPWLAHVATYEALQAVDGMFGLRKPKRVGRFPACTYCQPQVGSIGMTEKVLKEKGIKYRVGKFPFAASGKAVAAGHAEGFVKVLTDEKHGEILGVHIVGYQATELLTEYALAMDNELTVEEIHHTIHAHPTLSEALAEAAAAVDGHAIHI